MSESDIQRILERLAVIETKIDMSRSNADDHEQRIRALERFKYLMIGAAAAIGGGSGALVSKILG